MGWYGRRRDRGRGRPADRRVRDDLLLLALGIRRRGRARRRDPAACPPHRDAPPEAGRGSTSSAPCSPRSGSGWRSSASCAPRMGLGEPETRRAGAAGRLADRLVGPRRAAGGVGLPRWESTWRRIGEEPLVRPSTLGNRQITGGLLMFFSQYLVQAGLFFTIPLFLSVALGLSALETGVRILPLSITLLAAAVGIPRLFPDASPRRVVAARAAGHAAGLVSCCGPRPTARRRDRDGAAAARRLRYRRPRLPARGGDGVARCPTS